MLITKYDGVAILPKRCDRCNRLFWLEPYNIFYKTVGVGRYSLKQIECLDCQSGVKGLTKYKPINAELMAKILDADVARKVYQPESGADARDKTATQENLLQTLFKLEAENERLHDSFDKMMAEINELYSYVEFDEDIKTSFNMVRLEEVQKVIDKYKPESEDKE